MMSIVLLERCLYRRKFKLYNSYSPSLQPSRFTRDLNDNLLRRNPLSSQINSLLNLAQSTLDDSRIWLSFKGARFERSGHIIAPHGVADLRSCQNRIQAVYYKRVVSVESPIPHDCHLLHDTSTFFGRSTWTPGIAASLPPPSLLNISPLT